jgi:hypothetical protein
MADEGWLGHLRKALDGKRVVPPDPPGRTSAGAANEPEDPEPTGSADQSAAWSAFITYTGSGGEESARVITFRRISGRFGQPETIDAHCHLRRAHRRFKLANITSMACAVSGEELDALENCLALHRTGALKIEDLVLTRLMRILTFMARCDGDFHALERRELEDLLGRYFRFFGGDDAAYDCAIEEAPRLAPSGDQFLKDLRWLKTAPRRGELARFAIEGCAAMIDADGRHATEEVHWAIDISDALKRIAGRA